MTRCALVARRAGASAGMGLSSIVAMPPGFPGGLSPSPFGMFLPFRKRPSGRVGSAERDAAVVRPVRSMAFLLCLVAVIVVSVDAGVGGDLVGLERCDAGLAGGVVDRVMAASIAASVVERLELAVCAHLHLLAVDVLNEPGLADLLARAVRGSVHQVIGARAVMGELAASERDRDGVSVRPRAEPFAAVSERVPNRAWVTCGLRKAA